MKTINIHETKTKLSAILMDIEKSGETYIICRNGKPVAELVKHNKRKRMVPDAFLSQVKVKCNLIEPLTEDDWDI